MACCARSKSNIMSRSYVTKKGVTTLVSSEKRTKTGCKYTKEDIVELYHKVRKSPIPEVEKNKIKRELADMSQIAHKVCPDEIKIESIKELVGESD